jgi:uncharacterized protein YkwD
MSRVPLLALLLSLFANSCAPFSEPAATQPSPPRAALPPVATATRRALARDVLQHANEARKDARVRALAEEEALTRAAELYAEELSRLQRLEHVSPTRGLETMTQRIEAAGGQWRRAGENLATTYGVANLPRAVIDMWLGSPGHRRNLLDSGFSQTGVGIARDTRGAWYIVQLYVLPPVRPPR